MPVSVRYAGRLGNNIIQYAAGRIFAEMNDLILETPWCWPNFFEATPCSSGVREVGIEPLSEMYLKDGAFDGTMNCAPAGTRYVFQGYFQQSSWLVPNRDRIRNFFRFPHKIVPNSQDLGIHARLTDGATLAGLNHIIHPAWYEQILSQEAKKFRKIVVLTDDPHAWNMFDVFKSYGAEIRSQTVPEDFMELMTFENMIMGPSTFSYTAALLGHAKKVWQHDPFITIPEVNLDFPGAVKVRGTFIDGRCK